MDLSAPSLDNLESKRHLRFAVIGAGMSGILWAIKLQEAGITDFTIYEKAHKLGGTWRDNRYPGLSCDVPSQLYSYTFEKNANWTKRFSPGGEIQEYFEGVASKYDVERFIKYNNPVESLEYIDGKWHLETGGGINDVVDIVICATGVLHHPRYPEIEGMDTFKGDAFHSARWKDDLDLTGKRVAVIGTGSTAIQIVPAIVDKVEEVSLFQRTAQWVMTFPNPEYTDEEKADYAAHPEKLDEAYDTWKKHFSDTFARAVIGDQREIEKIAERAEWNLNVNVEDEELREKLRPDYVAACKRMVFSNDFYPAMQKDNANLVTEGIERIEENGIRTTDGKLHELDVIVYCTGFYPHVFMKPMNIKGKGGITLEQKWENGAEAYRSVVMPDFPNLFMMIGPNSPIGNFSIIMVSELQLDYIMQLVNLIQTGQIDEIEPKQDVTDRYNQSIRDAMEGTVWVSGCRSWYLDQNGNPATWPWTIERYIEEMSKPDLADFVMAPARETA